MLKNGYKILDAHGLVKVINKIRHTEDEVSFATCYETDGDGAVLESSTSDWWGVKFIHAFDGIFLLVGTFGGGTCYTFDVGSDESGDTLQSAIVELLRLINTKDVCTGGICPKTSQGKKRRAKPQEHISATQTLLDIQLAREKIIGTVNSRFDNLITRLNVPNTLTTLTDSNNAVHGGYAIPIAINPTIFNAKKAVAVVFGEERVYVKSWRDVVHTILTRCCQDPIYNKHLLALRGNVAGHTRMLLSDNPDEMVKPLMIVEGLYVEVHHGATAMINMLVKKLLEPIGYDYSKLFIEVR
ncbi:MAG: hypothetical protein FWB87_13595 [Defluviitaleaceae bacterium]|nr:hypothetical protein [Defluviitaleaceae bacterium]